MVKRCSCGLYEPQAEFYGKETRCTRCKEKKRVERVHNNAIQEMKEKLQKLEEENAKLLSDKKFLKSIIKEKSREVNELESVRVECDAKLEQMEEEIYATKSTQHVLDIRIKEMGSILSMNNLGLAGYMTKVDEMRKEVSDLNAIMEKQMDINNSMSSTLNRCIVYHEDQLE